MGFSYTIMSEQEAIAERYQMIKPGEYDAIISASVDKVSASSGNPMMDMTLTVFDEYGKDHDVRDFLVFTNSMMWKVIKFANSAGLSNEYGDGKLCSEVAIGKKVRVKIGIDEGKEIPFDKLKDKPMGSKYPDKNKVEDYIKKEDQKPLYNNDLPPDHLDDEVPFLKSID